MSKDHFPDVTKKVPERENAEERYCYQMLAELRKSYELAAKPYIDRLVEIKSRQAPSITLTLGQAREFVDFTMSVRDGPNAAGKAPAR